MEVVSILSALLCGLCMLSLPITSIIWIILSIKKSEKKRLAKRIFLYSLIGIILTAIIVVATAETCEHSWETIVKVEPTCTEGGSTVKYCTLCNEEQEGEDVPALGHSWIETIKEATCTERGERTKECSVCGETSTEVIEAQHKYSESIVTKPKCETTGVAKLTCTVCGKKENKTIAATGHSWQNATCTAAKTCSECKAKEGKSLGHTTDAGVCYRCNETIKKQSPVTIIGMKYTKDYVGGIEWEFKIRNNSKKEIKYVILQWTCYNAVGDTIRDEISGKNYVRLRFTGPLAPGKTSGWQVNTSRFYNHSYSSMKWTEITVEYMDGTTETIGEFYKGYYEK